MKIFDNWIKKQFRKRFPEEFIELEALMPRIITRNVEIIKSKQIIELEKETDELIPVHVKLEELSRKFIPLIADNIKIKRFEDPLRQLVIYEAMLEIIPAEKDVIHNKIYRNESCDRAGKCIDYIEWHCTGCNGAKEEENHDI